MLEGLLFFIFKNSTSGPDDFLIKFWEVYDFLLQLWCYGNPKLSFGTISLLCWAHVFNGSCDSYFVMTITMVVERFFVMVVVTCLNFQKHTYVY